MSTGRWPRDLLVVGAVSRPLNPFSSTGSFRHFREGKGPELVNKPDSRLGGNGGGGAMRVL